jgi:Raf kinase inhibitor-like YbhB/YbcL family protein
MRSRSTYKYIPILVATLMLTGCHAANGPSPEGELEMSIQLTSTAFAEGGTIPKQFTCDGEDASPPLAWSGIPANAYSLALIADDPDAPVGTWVHWVIFDMPSTLTGLPQGVTKTLSIPDTSTQGKNDFGKPGYGGPCPPKGKPHRYFFKLYALDAKLNLKPGASKAEVENAMKGHILAQGQLMGLYGR